MRSTIHLRVRTLIVCSTRKHTSDVSVTEVEQRAAPPSFQHDRASPLLALALSRSLALSLSCALLPRVPVRSHRRHGSSRERRPPATAARPPAWRDQARGRVGTHGAAQPVRAEWKGGLAQLTRRGATLLSLLCADGRCRRRSLAVPGLRASEAARFLRRCSTGCE